MASFSEPLKAWARQVELVVYDPARAPSAAILESGGQQFGLKISDLDIDFEVKRSLSFSENTASFKVYNASEQTRRLIQSPGMRLQFSAGYKDQGGLVMLFTGSILPEVSSTQSNGSWITSIPCISALTESAGAEDLATWAEKHKDATLAQKQEKITSAINRIPVSLGYSRDSKVRSILNNLSTITGLVLYGAEGLDPLMTFPNGWTYVGGVRGAMQALDRMLRDRGWALVVDNSSMLIYPLNGGNLTATAAYLTYETGLIKAEQKSKDNIPPKMDKSGKKIPVTQSYTFDALLSPKIAPNTLVKLKTPGLDTTIQVAEVTFSGNNYGGDFKVSGMGNVWNGPGDTYRKAF